jgi:fatty acid desaturase
MAGMVAFHAAVLVAVPLLAPALAVLLLGLLPLSVVQWGLIHEAIHKHLHDDAAMNDRQGRLLGICLGASFHVLRFGHLMHHRMNRHWHGEHQRRPGLGGALYYYANLCFGLYLGEVITSLLLTFLPRPWFLRVARATFLRGYADVAVAGERFFYQRRHVRMVRWDMLASLALYALAFALYGTAAWWLATCLAGRAMVISFLDNMYHYATPADNSKAGKELQLPPLVSALLLHSNYHETHHLNPDVPWRALPQLHAQQGRAFDGAWLCHAFMQWRVPPLQAAAHPAA